jgi:hypothetical protein
VVTRLYFLTREKTLIQSCHTFFGETLMILNRSWGASRKLFVIPVFVAVLTTTITCGRLNAAITQYSNRAAFLLAAGPVTTEDFESVTPGPNVFEGTPYDFGDFTGVNGPNGSLGGDVVGSGNVNGSIELFPVLALNGATFELVFDYPITALGFDADNLADQKTDRFSFNNLAANTVTVSDPLDRVRFWGFISDTPFTKMTLAVIATPSGTDGIRLDDLTYSVIPEPSTLCLALCSTVILLRRRRSG